MGFGAVGKLLGTLGKHAFTGRTARAGLAIGVRTAGYTLAGSLLDDAVGTNIFSKLGFYGGLTRGLASRTGFFEKAQRGTAQSYWNTFRGGLEKYGGVTGPIKGGLALGGWLGKTAVKSVGSWPGMIKGTAQIAGGRGMAGLATFGRLKSPLMGPLTMGLTAGTGWGIAKALTSPGEAPDANKYNFPGGVHTLSGGRHGIHHNNLSTAGLTLAIHRNHRVM